MTIDKFLIFVLLGNLILKDYFDKEWTVWLWVAAFAVRASEAARKIANALYPALKAITRLRKANEVME
ncbi:hypothetical protein [Lactococcus formosensis]|uniref:hypothetical protein n=1 Tax=Lactococcus formosensis TaxID=1281486 RepID=UPI003264CD8A